jgi:hypothetical protein
LPHEPSIKRHKWLPGIKEFAVALADRLNVSKYVYIQDIFIEPQLSYPVSLQRYINSTHNMMTTTDTPKYVLVTGGAGYIGMTEFDAP